MHQSTTPSLSQTIWPRWASRQFVTLPIVQTLLPVTFAYSQSSEAVVMRQLRRWKRLWWRSLTRSHKRTSMGPSRSCWNGSRSALQPAEITYLMILVQINEYDHHHVAPSEWISPDRFPPPLPIGHRFQPVFKATYCIGTELLYIGSRWSSCLCSSIWRGPQEYITYKFVPTSSAVSHMSGSFNLDSFRDGW